MTMLDADVRGSASIRNAKFKLKVPPKRQLDAYDFTSECISGEWFLLVCLIQMIAAVWMLPQILTGWLYRALVSKSNLFYTIDDTGILLLVPWQHDVTLSKTILSWKLDKVIGYEVVRTDDQIKVLLKIQKRFSTITRHMIVSPSQLERVEQELLPILDAHVAAQG